MKKFAALLAVLAFASVGLAACGGDDDDGDTTAAAETTTTEEPATDTAATGGGAGGTIDISAPADGSFAYDQTEIEAAAGPETINFDNPAQLSHDVTIEDESGADVGATDLVSEGQATADVELTPGTYTFYCSVPGHREGGMEGTITVK